MNVVDIPSSSVVIVSSDVLEIAKALQLVWGNGGFFWSYEPIHGAHRSGRVFFRNMLIEGRTVELPGVTNVTQLAEELMRLVPEARYFSTPPEGNPRGWEIRASMVCGCVAVIAWAAHCPKIQDI